MLVFSNLFSQQLFHWICTLTSAGEESRFGEADYQGQAEAEDFVNRRFASRLDFTGRSVMDVGCGFGELCIYAAQHGASHVLGIDIDEDRINSARRDLLTHHPELQGVVEFLALDSLDDLGNRRFDLILSKDSFEHIDAPESFVLEVRQFLAPGGELAIGFGPLWCSPYGGHMGFMTMVPWAHLIFPEKVIMQERRRYRPLEHASRFEEVRGGLNRMTLGRFERAMAATGLRRAYFQTNVKDGKLAAAFNLLRRIPMLREFCTFNVYSVWSQPPVPSTSNAGSRVPFTANASR